MAQQLATAELIAISLKAGCKIRLVLLNALTVCSSTFLDLVMREYFLLWLEAPMKLL